MTGDSRLYARNHTRLDPAMGDAQSVEYTIDPNYADYSYLAAGETITETFSINYWGYTKTIDLVMTGLNDAPELDDGILAASEDGPLVSLDLAGLGSDIDSDDDGASLTYSIIDAPAGANVYLVGTELFFDPGSGYQNLNDGDVQELVVPFRRWTGMERYLRFRMLSFRFPDRMMRGLIISTRICQSTMVRSGSTWPNTRPPGG